MPELAGSAQQASASDSGLGLLLPAGEAGDDGGKGIHLYFWPKMVGDVEGHSLPSALAIRAVKGAAASQDETLDWLPIADTGFPFATIHKELILKLPPPPVAIHVI
jgi:hypothetical protein